MTTPTLCLTHYKTLWRTLLASATLAALAALTACGGGGAATTAPAANPIVTLSPAPLMGTPSNSSVSDTTSVGTTTAANTPTSTSSVASTSTPTVDVTNPPASPTSTAGTTPTVPAVSITACNDPQTNLPSRGTATQTLLYEDDGRNGNTLTTIDEFSQGLVNPDVASFGTGPYYALLTVSTPIVVTDGLSISPLAGGVPFINYYQFSNNKPGLVGTKTLTTTRTRTLATTLYTPVFYNPLFSLVAGQSETYTVNSTVAASGATPNLQTKTQRIEHVGLVAYMVGPTSYTACKYITTDPSKTNGETTTLWYWLGKDILLQSVIQENDSLGNKVLVERRILKSATLGGNVFFYRK
jgi:hypothetical protein